MTFFKRLDESLSFYELFTAPFLYLGLSSACLGIAVVGYLKNEMADTLVYPCAFAGFIFMACFFYLDRKQMKGVSSNAE